MKNATVFVPKWKVLPSRRPATNHIPYVIIRAISDKADGSDVIDYPVFEKKPRMTVHHLVEYMMKHLNSQYL